MNKDWAAERSHGLEIKSLFKEHLHVSPCQFETNS